MASQRVVVLADMGPVRDEVHAFVKAVFAPATIKKVKAEAFKSADVLVCGDWRIIPRGDARPQTVPGGTVLHDVLDNAPAPKTLIYAILGGAELSRAMRPRARGFPAIDGWRRVVGAGGRVVILQVDRWNARRPFTVADAVAALPSIPKRSVVLWHEPAKPII